jgi:hypothetical protein
MVFSLTFFFADASRYLTHNKFDARRKCGARPRSPGQLFVFNLGMVGRIPFPAAVDTAEVNENYLLFLQF